ncbi:MAG: hypothetical protein AB8H79_18105 [Myxococcota bacterium]
MRILAWLLLIVGVGLAAAGGTVLGPQMSTARSYTGPLGVAEEAMSALESAHAAHASAMDVLRHAERNGDNTTAQKGVQEATARLTAARATIADLQATGLLSASPPLTVSTLKAASEANPPPLERLMEWLSVGGPWWGAGLLMVVVGAFLERRHVRAQSRNPTTGAGAVDFLGTLDQIEHALDAVAAQIADLEMDGASGPVRDELDRVQDELITPLVDGRMQLAARHGNAMFSIYFSAFSGAERNLARVWSALTDGHSVVARESLARAQAGLKEARAGWDRAELTLES